MPMPQSSIVNLNTANNGQAAIVNKGIRKVTNSVKCVLQAINILFD
jgi:recombinational DNA repair protein (RecF pathway)